MIRIWYGFTASGLLCSDPFFLLIQEDKTISEVAINEQIRDKEIRLIGEHGEQLGIMSAKEAYFKAQDAGLDLIKIAPTAKPPVCKIADYGKYKYEQLRREKEAKKRQKEIEVKELRLSPNIDDNDLNTKANQAKKFLSKGDKLKVSLRFRGREMAHVGSNSQVLDKFIELLEEPRPAPDGILDMGIQQFLLDRPGLE